MHVIFMAPNFPANQREFVRALHAVGAKVTGIGDSPVEHLDSELKSWLSGYEHIASLADEAALLNAGVNPEELDMIIVATVTPDMFFPSTACFVSSSSSHGTMAGLTPPLKRC